MKELKKMTKKERKAYFSAQRGSWYGLNPRDQMPQELQGLRPEQAQGRACPDGLT